MINDDQKCCYALPIEMPDKKENYSWEVRCQWSIGRKIFKASRKMDRDDRAHALETFMKKNCRGNSGE